MIDYGYHVRPKCPECTRGRRLGEDRTWRYHIFHTAGAISSRVEDWKGRSIMARGVLFLIPSRV